MGKGVIEPAEMKTDRVRHGGYERRAAARYEDREQSAAKDEQRESVAAWLLMHHKPEEHLRLLSLPDRYWTFENRLNDRRGTSFLGIQRDWATLQNGVAWMPTSKRFNKEKACPVTVRAATGDIAGYIRHRNIVLHMWAGHLLSFDNINPGLGRGLGSFGNGCVRRVTAAWLDFTGPLTDEVVQATTGLPVVLGRKTDDGVWPVVTTFLAGRDCFRSHEDRVTHLLIAIQQAKRHAAWRYRFNRFEVHTGSSTFISVFGSYHQSGGKAPVADDRSVRLKKRGFVKRLHQWPSG